MKNELVVHSHTGRDITAGGNLIRLRRRSASQIDELDVRSTAMLLGAEDAPKEINGVGGPMYIFGGFGGAGGVTGFKLNGLLLTSTGGFDPPKSGITAMLV